MRLEEWFFQLTHRADSESLVGQHVSVVGSWDVAALLPTVSLCVLLMVCCCLLPGVRRRRLHSTLLVIWGAGTGCGLVCAYSNSSWAVMGGRVRTVIAYAAPRRVDCLLTVHFGLHGADLQLASPTGRFHYREQLEWPLTPRGMTELYRSALRRGLPAPLVTTLEVLSKDAAPCTWGRHFRRAGYLAGWLAKMALRFDGVVLGVQLSWCLWLTVAVGLLNLAFGGWMLLSERRRPGSFSSVFELDFGQPQYRFGWHAAGKPLANPKPRSGLTLNIDFSTNDLSGGGRPPTDEKINTPSCDPPMQPFWTPGSIPRRPIPLARGTREPPLISTSPERLPASPCHQRTPCNSRHSTPDPSPAGGSLESTAL
ncbi:uncharacterized protein LOC119097340 [Pollicipes pollicipes]|uniref:uncharacterized protein LOC119097340 n=1 Tax=Pollicipes pollicipes TaxID=41117 RepID=UPI001884E438|nr:uncharacterized protein LOC119097340 [Pollicipes pollicipes]